MRPILKDLTAVAAVGILNSSLVLSITFLTGYENNTVHPAFLPLFFFPVSVITLVLIHIGSRKDPANQTSLTLAAIFVKFLLPAVLALIWFATLKNNTITDIFLFFIVYLSFGISTVLLMLKKLKKQP